LSQDWFKTVQDKPPNHCIAGVTV